MECVTKPKILTLGMAAVKTITSIKESSGRITKYEIAPGCT